MPTIRKPPKQNWRGRMLERRMPDRKPDALRLALSARLGRGVSVLSHGGDVQRRKFRCRFIVAENENTVRFRRNSGVIWRGHIILAAIARSDGERNEWCRVQELANAGNHESKLLEERGSLNTGVL